MRHVALSLIAYFVLVSSGFSQNTPLVVHEWGTFTSLQDGSGRALGAINQDTEPLPGFVKNLNPGEGGPKGIPISQSVTMRLETPVVYFHPAKGSAPMTLSFSAEFHGGQLTQFYPNAVTNVDPNKPVTVDAKSVGRLEWKNFTIGKPMPGPATTSPVWLAPRKVDAADVSTPGGESERYLFYRGVGQLDSPLKVVRIGDHVRMSNASDTSIDIMWYFDVRADGACAYRKFDTSTMDINAVVTPAAFAENEYRDDSLARLQADMKQHLIKAGLFDDEAEAMLNTWRDSYFKSPGARVFFMVPRAWVDRVLPIKVSVPANIERVMVGRVDLVTPTHQALARAYLDTQPTDPDRAQKLYKDLGRFAGAIINDEMLRRQQGARTPVSVR
jgi:hypothetical protein